MAKKTPMQAADGLANALTGVGTNRDPRQHAQYMAGRCLTQTEIHSAYLGSGLIRKIVSIPAFDAIREWREWRAEQSQIEQLEAEEARLGLREKVLMAETLRAMGGGALVLGLPGNPELPAPANVGKGGLAFVNVVSRWHLQFQEVSDDPTAPGFGEPVMWSMSTKSGTQVKIHPSRVIAFRADGVAAMVAPSATESSDAFWGVSVVQHVLDAVQDSDTARQSFAALLNKARLLRIGIPGLMDLVATADGEATVMKRIALLAQAEGILNATIYDAGDPDDGKGGETIGDAQYSFAGAKDIINAYADFCAAVADIPATRLLGRAAEGLNSSGDSQQKDWAKKIRAIQTLFVGPRLARVDAYLIPSALGSRPKEVWYDFAPLEAPDEDKAAARFKTVSEALDGVKALNAMPEIAFNKAAQNALVEGGWMPGLEQALAEIPEAERFGLVADPAAADPEAKGGDPISAGTGEVPNKPSPARAANDAAPRTLYVQRKLLNADEFIAWAKEQGFTTTTPAGDLHVTVAFSRQRLDWMKVGDVWSSGDNGNLTVAPGGARLVEPLGDKGAAVLLFNSSTLSWRHEEIQRAGASWDHPEYQPHVTITYAKPEGMDLSKVKPYRGKLEFGPEIFDEVNEDWASNLVEDGGSRISGLPFEDARVYRRDKHGRFASSGGSASSIKALVAKAVAAPGEHFSLEIGAAASPSPAMVHGYARRLHSGNITHALNEHGNRQREKARGQLPISRADITKVPHIVANAHTVAVHGDGKKGRAMSISYTAGIGQRQYTYVETVGTKRQQVVFKTMWKK